MAPILFASSPRADSSSPGRSSTENLQVRDLLDHVPVGLCLIDEALTVVGWNRALVEWTGISEREIRGRRLSDRLPHLAEPRYLTRIQNVLETGAPAVLSAALHRHFFPAPACVGAQNRTMVQETRIQRVSTEPRQALITVQNLTTEYNQLEALRAERAELKRIREELVASNSSLQHSLRLLEENNDTLQREIQIKAEIEAELRRHSADLESSRLREQCHVVRLEQVIRDLTEARQAAESAARAKSEFLANMSHEIRTPLTAILGFVDLLRDAESPAEERTQALDTVHRNGQHLLAVINDVLDLSKIDAGQLQVERIPARLRQIVEEIRTLLESRATSRGLHLSARFDDSLSEIVVTDPVRLRQILMNLVGNAIKFTETGGVDILVSESRRPDLGPSATLIEIQVRDTGIGITSEQLQRLFQAFAQADASTTRRYGGTGLGLIISRKLARALGGDLTAESRPGHGSSFTVTIQAETLTTSINSGIPQPTSQIASSSPKINSDIRAPQTKTPQARVPVNSGRLAGLHLLVVDDAPDNRRLLAYHLSKAGATFDVAENGLKAVERILDSPAAAPVDAVFLDMQMPIMDGYTAAAILRDRGFTAPIIAITAHAMAGDRERCLACGCTNYLTKPVDKESLLRSVSCLARETALQSAP
ncbi:MAG TPA: ATP-binding protein [Planctomycetaceae bacterium]|nr:ATP-binding protein [Planctomycetaceae bacterium]